jgi:hypothetical protein
MASHDVSPRNRIDSVWMLLISDEKRQFGKGIIDIAEPTPRRPCLLGGLAVER